MLNVVYYTKEFLKERILDVSLKLFSEKGYKSTSVRDIAKDVGITQSGLYNHFKGKDAILETKHRRNLQTLEKLSYALLQLLLNLYLSIKK